MGTPFLKIISQFTELHEVEVSGLSHYKYLYGLGHALEYVMSCPRIWFNTNLI